MWKLQPSNAAECDGVATPDNTAVAPCDLGPPVCAVHSPDCANKAEGTDTFTCWGCFI